MNNDDICKCEQCSLRFTRNCMHTEIHEKTSLELAIIRFLSTVHAESVDFAGRYVQNRGYLGLIIVDGASEIFRSGAFRPTMKDAIEHATNHFITNIDSFIQMEK